MQVQCKPFIMQCLGSIVMDHVIDESCYKATTCILQKNYREMTITYNSFVKFLGKNFRSHMTMLYPNLCYNEVCYKGTVLYTLVVWCIIIQYI